MKPGDVIGSRYRVEKLLGRGGMGEVWLAVDTSLHDRPVAVKRVLQQLGGDEALQRFEREVKALAGLNHPHIVTVMDAGHDERGVYYVMEYIPGTSLREWLHKQGESMPSLQQVADTFKQILRGVAFAHSKGVVHRDLKPENVLITDDGTVKVLDFGLAKLALDDSLTQPGQRMGTPLYMAPEQGRGAACDARTDVYALGVMFFELCTLQTPFEGDNWMSLVYQHQNAEPPHPKSYRKDLPDRYGIAILKALEKNPKNRYLSAREFLVALDGTTQGATIPTQTQTPATPQRESNAREAGSANPNSSAASSSGLLGRLRQIHEEEEVKRNEEERRRAEREAAEREQRASEDVPRLSRLLLEQIEKRSFIAAWTTVSRLRRLLPEDGEVIESAKYVFNLLPKCAGSVAGLKLPGDVLMEFVFIPPGKFLMGSPENEPGRQPNEGPQHEVTIAYPFWLGKYPVTQAQWQSMMGNNPSHFQGDERRPVEQVSWTDCQGFIQKVNALRQGTFRLPSEAEWEYACRAGSTTAFSFGASESELGDYAWHQRNSGNLTHPVGEKKANGWGLHDMHGHVWEWCQDWGHDNYIGAPADGRVWESPEGQARVVRGGWSWSGLPVSCRAANRHNVPPDKRDGNIGFRLLRTQA